MRASLLASTTTATFLRRRPSNRLGPVSCAIFCFADREIARAT